MENPEALKIFIYSYGYLTRMSTAIDISRIVFGMAFLLYASYTDIKTRKVKNEVWIIMGVTGCILLSLQLFLEKRAWEYFLILFPVGVLFGSMLIDHKPVYDAEKKKINFKILIVYLIGLIALIYQMYALSNETYFYQLLTIPVLIVFFYVLYQFGVLHGGADAKAMMAIAIFMPFYPHFWEFPLIDYASENVASAMELMFPFAFLVLMNSVLFVIWVFLALLIFNAARGDLAFPEMLLGYKMDINDVEKKFVWPMERIVDEERVRVLFPKKTDFESLKKLKEMGVKKIWVTPKIPFIMFITGGFVISVFVGNIFVAFFGMIV